MSNGVVNGRSGWLSPGDLMVWCVVLFVPCSALARSHTVVAGDTLEGIAIKHRCVLEQLKAANRAAIPDPARMQIGARVVLPASCGTAPLRAAAPSAVAGAAVTDCDWTPDHVQVGTLRKAMKRRRFRAPRRFRALVVKTLLSRNRRRILRHQVHSWGKLATSPKGWNPASTVKLFSAISALEQVRRRGLGVNAMVTFHYSRGDRTFSLKELFEDAMHWSKNIAHNRLVQLAGYDFLNGPNGTLRRAGLDHTYVMRAYAEKDWVAQGNSRYLRRSPRITLRQGRRRRTIKARVGRGRYPCHGAACTSLSDLAKTMCRMMLHEQLSPHRRLRLGDDSQSPHLKMLRQAMDSKRKGRSDSVWDAVQRQFPPAAGYVLFHKGGFSQDWLSDNIYIYNPRLRTRWIITMACYPGRKCMTRAAGVIARILRSGKL